MECLSLDPPRGLIRFRYALPGPQGTRRARAQRNLLKPPYAGFDEEIRGGDYRTNGVAPHLVDALRLW